MEVIEGEGVEREEEDIREVVGAVIRAEEVEGEEAVTREGEGVVIREGVAVVIKEVVGVIRAEEEEEEGEDIKEVVAEEEGVAGDIRVPEAGEDGCKAPVGVDTTIVQVRIVNCFRIKLNEK